MSRLRDRVVKEEGEPNVKVRQLLQHETQVQSLACLSVSMVPRVAFVFNGHIPCVRVFLD